MPLWGLVIGAVGTLVAGVALAAVAFRLSIAAIEAYGLFLVGLVSGVAFVGFLSVFVTFAIGLKVTTAIGVRRL